MTLLLGWFAAVLVVGGAPQAAPAKEVEALVRQLASPSFRTREEATKRLAEIGRPARTALRELLTGGDLESRRRAEHILEKIDPVWRNLARLPAAGVEARREALKNLLGYRDAYLVGPLVGWLPRETDPQCLHDLATILGMQGDRRAVKPLLRAYAAGQKRASFPHEAILTAVGRIGDPSAADFLLDLCRDRAKKDGAPAYAVVPSVGWNEALARALGGTRDPRAVELLLMLASAPYDGAGGGVVMLAVMDALEKIGPAALPHLERWAGGGRRYEAQYAIARAAARIGDKKAVPLLTRMLGDDMPEIAAEAAAALDELGSDRGADWVAERLAARGRRPPWSGRPVVAALAALGRCKHPSLRELSERILTTAAPSQRFDAAEALARMGVEKGNAFLREQLRDDTYATHALTHLERLGDRTVVPEMVRLAGHERQDIVQAAIPALGRAGTKAAADALVRMARGPEVARGYARVKRDSIRALGKVRTRRVVEALLGLLGDADEEVAGAAQWALVEIAGAPVPDAARLRAWWDYHRDDFPADSPCDPAKR